MRRALLLPLLLTFIGCDAPAPAAGGGGGGPGILPVSSDGGVECDRPERGCPCGEGQPPIDCYLDPSERDDGSFVCHAGTRYCRDGAWSGCESIRDYTIAPSTTALIGSPTQCNACDPRCFTTRDTPTTGDLTPGNSSGVTYDPTAGGITITPDIPAGVALTDSDGDGVPDVADDCPGAGWYRHPDGTCATGGVIYHTLPQGASAIDPINVSTQIRTADVYFLMDTTGSMGGELSRLQTDLTSGTFGGATGGIIGAIRATIPDAWFGVGYFDDYPVDPYGGAGDRVFQNVLDIQSSLPATQTAINSLSIHWGNDGPESNTQALWAVATGGGLSSYLPARSGCAAGRWGYPCFRAGTIPIVIHITDAPFHNGPGNIYPYCIGGSLGTRPTPAATAVSGNERLDATAHFVDLTETWVSFSGNTSSMVHDVAPGCGSTTARDAVFRIRLTTRQYVRITTDGSSFDTVLGLRPVSGGTWTCNDDGGSGTNSMIQQWLDPGDYYVVVDGHGTASGAYRLTMGWPYQCSGYAGVQWADAATALASRNVRVITVQTCGVWSDSYCLEGEAHARTLGNATGSLGSSGSPYVFRGAANGTGLSTTIVDAIVDLANYSRMDVTARAVGDTAGFTRSIVAQSFSPSAACAGISGGTTFLQCLPGTNVNFQITFRNDAVAPMATPQVFTFFIEVVGNGSAVLTRVPVRIVVPAQVASYPPSGSYWHDYDSSVRCAINERPIWGNLTWTATVPSGTQLELELRAHDQVAMLPTATPVVRILVPTATSPRNIASALRAAGYPDGRRALRVTAILRSDAMRRATPTLTDLSVTYTCVPAE